MFHCTANVKSLKSKKKNKKFFFFIFLIKLVFRQNKTKPILLIDLHSFLRTLLKDLQEVLCGIRHQKVYEHLEKLLDDLSQIADLIFYNGKK